MKDAKANGQVGPDLDMLKPDAAEVKIQVSNGGGGMPSFRNELSAKEIDAVSSYVAESAGK